MGLPLNNVVKFFDLPQIVSEKWPGRIDAQCNPDKLTIYLMCSCNELQELSGWLFSELGYSLATIVVEEGTLEWTLRYIYYGEFGGGQVHVIVRCPLKQLTIPSISTQVHAADWQEREIEDLFGITFKGHPRLGDFVLHEEWPEGVNPMRLSFDAFKPYPHKETDPKWRPLKIVKAPGSFMMPIGPVFSDYAESAQFLLETVGEDVIRTIPRFFYKYRGIEKIAEGQPVDKVLLLAERFSGTSAFAHSFAFCQAVEDICDVQTPLRAKALRTLMAELERFRHHVAAISGICSSTGLAVAANQASILEEDLLRLTCRFAEHRYLFGINIPGGLTLDIKDDQCKEISEACWKIFDKLKKLQEMLRFASSFLDRLEEVGQVSKQEAISYGLVGPVARASAVSRDLRETLFYAYYEEHLKFHVPVEEEGDGYARLRILFREAEQSVNLIQQVSASLPSGPVNTPVIPQRGSALGWAEAPRGATFHWVRLDEESKVLRYRLMTPSFVNWHGFHFAAENFAFQDFPIIMATFGLSNAESDR